MRSRDTYSLHSTLTFWYRIAVLNPHHLSTVEVLVKSIFYPAFLVHNGGSLPSPYKYRRLTGFGQGTPFTT